MHDGIGQMVHPLGRHPFPFPSGGVWVGIPSPPRVMGPEIHTPPGRDMGPEIPYPSEPSGRYVSYWIAFLFLLFATAPVAVWLNIQNPLIIRATNSYRFQELNIPNTFLRFKFACCALNLKFPNVIYSILVVVICLRRRRLLPIFFRKNHGCTTLQLNHLSFPKLKNGESRLETDVISSK